MDFNEWKAAKNAAKSERDKQLTKKQAEIDNAEEWLQKCLDMWNSGENRSPECADQLVRIHRHHTSR